MLLRFRRHKEAIFLYVLDGARKPYVAAGFAAVATLLAFALGVVLGHFA